MLIDETLLLEAQQTANEIRSQIVGHHEFLLVAIARREIQLTTKDGRKNVELL